MLYLRTVWSVQSSQAPSHLPECCLALPHEPSAEESWCLSLDRIWHTWHSLRKPFAASQQLPCHHRPLAQHTYIQLIDCACCLLSYLQTSVIPNLGNGGFLCHEVAFNESWEADWGAKRAYWEIEMHRSEQPVCWAWPLAMDSLASYCPGLTPVVLMTGQALSSSPCRIVQFAKSLERPWVAEHLLAVSGRQWWLSWWCLFMLNALCTPHAHL